LLQRLQRVFLGESKMKNRSIVAMAIIAVAGLAANAMADGRIRINDATGAYNGSDGSGGAFTISRHAGSPFANGDYNGTYGGNRISGDGRGNTSFLSFCLERNENIGFGGEYYTEIATSAAAGGLGGASGGVDPLSSTTQKLYREFRNLADSNDANVSTTGRFNGHLSNPLSLTGTDVTAIQNAIWFSEGELNSISGAALLIYNWANLGTTIVPGSEDVRVLRLWTNWNASSGYSGFAQDQLTLIPLPPAAWAGLGSLAGVAAFGMIRRRKLAAV